MFILDNPLMYFIFSLTLLALLMIFFKILNYLDTKKKSKVKKSEEKKEEKNIESNETSEDKIVVYSGENYLYDRFVLTPTDDDKVNVKQSADNVFLSEEEYQEIKNKKVNIKVKDIDNQELSTRLEQIINNNKQEKEKLLNEYNSLSKQMKLLLIENILNKN